MSVDIFKAIIVPILLAFLTGGGGVAGYLKYKTERPSVKSQSRKTDAEAETLFANGWKDLAQGLEARITNLEKLMATREAEYLKTLKEKEREIVALNARIDGLELELNKYKTTTTEKIEVAKEDIHIAVDESIDQLKP